MVNKLEDLVLYQKAVALADAIFPIVEKWQYFYQNTLGQQLVRASDSVAANISEGFGRFYYKENKQFCYFARGSLLETRTHLNSAVKRGLIDPVKHKELVYMIDEIHLIMNNYIRSIGTKKQEP